MLIGVRTATFSGNSEEAMYKELYEQAQAFINALLANNSNDLVEYGGFDGTIGANAFYKIIPSVRIENATTVGNNAFMYSNQIEIDLPNVTTVGSAAFRFASNLKTLRLPSSTSIDNGGIVLAGTSALQDVYINSLLPSATGYPWGCANASTRFHCADGKIYDKDKNEIVE